MKKSQLMCAIWPWGTGAREEMETALTEIVPIGFKSFESVRAAIYAFNNDVDAYKEVLNRHGVEAGSFYFHIPYYGGENGLFDTLERDLEFVAKLGITRATLQGTGGRPLDGVMTMELKEHNLNNMLKFAKIAKTFGIKTNVHPHIDTYFMYEDEVDFVMQNTDKDLIYFAPDTAHLAAADMDPAVIMKRYADRINFVHLKDYKLGEEATYGGWVDSGVPIVNCFCELGKGVVNFSEVFKVLNEAKYTGPLCTELDRPPVSNVESAINNYNFAIKFLED